ncbi:MAG: gliding motility-associated C-terminal domain-containing protein [Bacteroidetes bacterium]|nr:gliding motility-associated C-terminal domain-containing protein [Bacteroidota bacterium]
MKKIFSIYLLFIGINSNAQFFSNTNAIAINNSIMSVNNMDFENFGDFSNTGEITINGNFINSGVFSSNTLNKSRIFLNLNWSNNLTFVAGKSDVIFTGSNQIIGGLAPTVFNILDFQGISGNIKTLQNNITCSDTLFLRDIELSANSFEFKINNGIIPVQRNSGYISTTNNGSLKIYFPVALNSYFEAPLGYGNSASQYKPVFLINPNNDSFGITLFGNSPLAQGMNPLYLHDSVCSINDSYYYKFKTFGSSMFYGITKSVAESYYTKLSRWDGVKWSKISNSGQTGTLAFSNLSLNSQSNFSTENISQAIEKPYVFAGNDFFLDLGQSKTIKTTGYFPSGSSILWTPSNNLSCDDCLEPVFTMGTPLTTVITVSNGPGCISSDTINILMKKDYRNLIPTSFTPNGDLLNDKFGPELLPGDKLSDLEIFNRWGQKIYKGTQNWDGTYKNTEVMQGVYLYKLMILSDEMKNGELKKYFLSGEFTLFR